MALSERAEFNSICIKENGNLEVRLDRIILDGSEELIRKPHRTVYLPNMPLASLPPKVRAIANLVWTPAVIAAWIAANTGA